MKQRAFAARLSAVQSERTFLIWSATADYKAVSMAGRLSSVAFSQAGSLITLAYKSLPGCTPDVLTATQRSELDRKNLNYYRAISGKNLVIGGSTLKPRTWVDVRYWVDWVKDAIRTDVFNLLTTSRRIPQTQTGITAIRDTITSVCEQGVRNGGIAPGQVSPALQARIAQAIGGDFEGFLPNGYLIHIEPLSTQSQTSRDAREAPPISVFFKGSGAVHFVDIDLTFEN